MEIETLVYNLNKNPQKFNSIELATFAHHELVRIHPFVDGNGRVARLLCNLVLIKNGWLPIAIRVKDRMKYFDVLEKAHFGNTKNFVDFIGLRAEESLIRYINALKKTTRETELLPLKDLVVECSYSQEYLSLLARRGILPSTKINGVWHSSREELDKYLKKIGKK